jgi:sugar phosphate isomerase/epimerase
MRLSQVALQLFTVRRHCQTAADLAATARKVREIGYPAVQISGVGPIPEKELLAILHGEGLAICATHEPGPTILDEPEIAIDRLQQLGVSLTAYPWPGDLDFSDSAQVDMLLRKLARSAEKFHAAGLRFGYHNHAFEFFRPVPGGPNILERIYAEIPPALLVAELDTFWIQRGGGDVVDWPFDRIIAVAEAGGCEWFIVEQDSCPGDPFDSIRQSLEYIRARFVT